MLTERRARILTMVAESYIHSAYPVPSSHIAERLDLSSATVRNEFSALEEDGYLQQPHTSAGRIPTPDGFLAYARAFLPPRRLPARQRRLVLERLLGVHGDALMQQLAVVAAELSGYAVVVTLPGDEQLRTLEIHLSLLSSRKLLAVVVLETGLVRQLVLDLDPPPTDDVLDDAERNLRQLTLPLSDVPIALEAIAGRTEAELARTLRALARAWPAITPPRRFSQGLSRLFSEPEARDPEFIRLVVEQVEALGGGDPESGEVVGSDPLSIELDEAVARISASFDLGQSQGTLMLIGPARMRYRDAFMIARGVSDALGGEPERS